MGVTGDIYPLVSLLRPEGSSAPSPGIPAPLWLWLAPTPAPEPPLLLLSARGHVGAGAARLNMSFPRCRRRLCWLRGGGRFAPSVEIVLLGPPSPRAGEARAEPAEGTGALARGLGRDPPPCERVPRRAQQRGHEEGREDPAGGRA